MVGAGGSALVISTRRWSAWVREVLGSSSVSMPASSWLWSLSDWEGEEEREEVAEEELCGDGVRLRFAGLDLALALEVPVVFVLVVDVEGRPRFFVAVAAVLSETVLLLDLALDLPGRGGEKEGRARFAGGMAEVGFP